MLIDELIDRSGNTCELCGSSENLSVYEVPPTSNANYDNSILCCSVCKGQIEKTDGINLVVECLSDTMVNSPYFCSNRCLAYVKSFEK